MKISVDSPDGIGQATLDTEIALHVRGTLREVQEFLRSYALVDSLIDWSQWEEELGG